MKKVSGSSDESPWVTKGGARRLPDDWMDGWEEDIYYHLSLALIDTKCPPPVIGSRESRGIVTKVHQNRRKKLKKQVSTQVNYFAFDICVLNLTFNQTDFSIYFESVCKLLLSFNSSMPRAPSGFLSFVSGVSQHVLCMAAIKSIELTILVGPTMKCIGRLFARPLGAHNTWRGVLDFG